MPNSRHFRRVQARRLNGATTNTLAAIDKRFAPAIFPPSLLTTQQYSVVWNPNPAPRLLANRKEIRDEDRLSHRRIQLRLFQLRKVLCNGPSRTTCTISSAARSTVLSWIQGLGYFPHIALYEDPVLLAAEDGEVRGAVLADRRGLSAVRQGRPPVRRALRDEGHCLGGPRRQSVRRYDRRPARPART